MPIAKSNDQILPILPMPPAPLQVATEIRSLIGLHAPELLFDPSDTIGAIVRAIGVHVAIAGKDDPLVGLAPKEGSPSVYAALWCHTGELRFAWDIDNPPPPDLPRANATWAAMTMIGHWLMQGEWIGNYSDLEASAPPLDAPTFVATCQPPITIFERLSASFAAAFLVPEEDVLTHIGADGTADLYRSLINDTRVLYEIAEHGVIPRWAAAYRLRDLAAVADARS